MFLSLLTLDPRSRRVQYRHRTGYQTHRSILTAFPMPLPPDERVLFRREDQADPPAIRLLVQSLGEPDWRPFADDHLGGMLNPPQVKPFTPAFFTGQVLAFRLLANPTVKRDNHRLGLFREEDQILWLARKGESGGFVIDPAGIRVQKRGFVRDENGGGHLISLLAVQFEGLLQITDVDRFLWTLRTGIGPAKGLGFGLLSVARVS